MVWKGRAVVLAVALVLSGAGPAGASEPPAREELSYSWTLRGFKGLVARVVVPGRGEGRLTTRPSASGGLATELLISSRDGRKDEYWLYGSELEPGERRIVRAWSEQHFRGERRRKDRTTGETDALDLAASIYYLRRERPEEPARAEIWSSGRVYPVEVLPGARRLVEWQGEPVAARAYALRPLALPGRLRWHGSLDLLLTDDERALPLEIVVNRKGLKIRLALEAAQS